MNRLIIVGSPRTEGRSASLANELFEACIEDYPDDGVSLAPVSTLDIAGCNGCNSCKELVEGWLNKPSEEASNRCVIEDDMEQIYELIDSADEIVVVSPVYFGGAPAQLTCLLNRFQPYYYAKKYKGDKRPLTLHVIGEGKDPFGYKALVLQIQDAFYSAGFELNCIVDWVGKIDEDGAIVEDASEFTVDEYLASVK
ncbi:MAG: flavodoxin family protein [Eggerthellaceae bacterium]|nr:flavodoxin family protein [Eggerthellaceae bacterium]